MKRPLFLTIIGWFFIAAGATGFVYHLPELSLADPFSDDAVWILVVRLVAIAGGILLLRGSNGGRWLLLAWMAYHVVLSYFHTISELVTHAILIAVIAFAFFHPGATSFFKAASGKRS